MRLPNSLLVPQAMPRNARKVVPDPGLDSPIKEMPLDDALQT